MNRIDNFDVDFRHAKGRLSFQNGVATYSTKFSCLITCVAYLRRESKFKMIMSRYVGVLTLGCLDDTVSADGAGSSPVAATSRRLCS